MLPLTLEKDVGRDEEAGHEPSHRRRHRGRSIVSRCCRVRVRSDRARQRARVEGGKSVTIDLVKEKLAADGWTGVQAMRRGRFVMAMASKDGRTEAFVVDTRTGRLHQNDDDDDD
jgi:hypothetical protein